VPRPNNALPSIESPVRVRLDISDATRKALGRLAADAGLSLASYVRVVVEMAAAGQLPSDKIGREAAKRKSAALTA
jgi:hypothetical protein